MSKLNKSQKIQAIFASLVTIFAGVIIWTNEGVDLLAKFGWNVNPGQSFMTFSIILFVGLFWLLVSTYKKWLGGR